MLNKISFTQNPIHPYPLVRSGGLFLLLIGSGIITDIIFKGAFMIGTGLAVLSLLFAKVLSFGKPSSIQIFALALAVLLEIVLLITISNVLPSDINPAVRLMWILMIVGIHFLPMAFCFGPRFGMVGILCILNASVGLVLGDLPSEVFLFTDGALKVGFGVWLFKKPSFGWTT